MNYTKDVTAGMPRHVFDLSGLSEAMEYAMRDPRIAAFKPASNHGDVFSRQCSHDDNASDWAGATWGETVKMATEGWQEGRDRIAKLSAEIFAQCAGTRRMAPRIHRNVSGFAPCVPAVLACDPESMYAIQRREVLAPGGKIITIVQNVFVSSGCSTESVMDRGIVAAALVDCLESLGYRVEFQYITGGRLYHDHTGARALVLMRFPLKFAQDAISFDALSSWVAHPVSFRKLGFALMEQCYPACDFVANSYCSPNDNCVPPAERGDLFINCADLSHTGPDRCALQLKDYLKTLGVEFEN